MTINEGRPDGAGNPEAARQRALSSPERETALTSSTRRIITLRPSTAGVWARTQGEGGCPASVTLPPASETQDTEAARRGTRLHAAMAARMSLDRLNAKEPRLNADERAVVDRAAEAARNVIASVFPPVGAPTIHWAVEQRLEWRAPLGQHGDRVYEQVIEGTPDLLLTGAVNVNHERHTRMLVLDYKFGDQPVAARENPQLMLYALMDILRGGHAGCLETLRPDVSVTLAIIQPARELPIKAWGCRWATLQDFGRRLLTTLWLMAEGPDDVIASAFTPSESNCRWCRGRIERTCSAHQTWMARQAIDHFRSPHQGDTHGDNR